MSKAVDDILSMYHKLSEEQQIEFNSRLMRSDLTMNEYLTDVRFVNGRCCPHCGSVHVVKNGKRSDGSQNYLCRDCGKQFNIRSNSIVSHSRKDMNVWQSFIECMLQGLSLRKTAEICKIHRNTAFAWRHKILDTLQNMAAGVVLDGVVEMDETFFNISFKGNHKNSKTFKMPRKAHHRGKSVSKRGVSAEKVCVPCAVNRSGISVAKVSNLGHISIKELHSLFDGKIANGAELCTDKMSAYRTFASDNGLNLHQLLSDKRTDGIYNIQHINSYHSKLKSFMSRFNGVSTKYLNNYLVWHNFVNYAGETLAEKKKILLRFSLSFPNTVLWKEINNREPLPLLNQFFSELHIIIDFVVEYVIIITEVWYTSLKFIRKECYIKWLLHHLKRMLLLLMRKKFAKSQKPSSNPEIKLLNLCSHPSFLKTQENYGSSVKKSN